MAKQNSIANKTVDFDSGVLTIAFADETAKTFDIAELPDEIVQRLALHGLSQKLGDSYAGASGEDDPLEFAQEAVTRVFDTLVKGEWSSRAAGTGAPRTTMLAEALSRATGNSLEECAAIVNPLREAVRGDEVDEDAKTRLDAIENHPAVKQALAQIRAERAAAKAAQAKGGDIESLQNLLG